MYRFAWFVPVEFILVSAECIIVDPLDMNCTEDTPSECWAPVF